MIKIIPFLKPSGTYSSFAIVLLALLSFQFLAPHTAEAARNEQEPLDLSILERRDALTSQMNRGQRLQLLRIEEAINQARSDLRSGQFMIDTKPTSMQPNRNVQAIQNEGKKIVAAAEATIDEGQRALVKLLQAVEENQNTFRPVDDSVLELTLETRPYSEALRTACEAVMKASWQRGYKALFFDSAFIRTSDAYQRVGSDVGNGIYDVLVAIDETNFTLTLPVDFKLRSDATGEEDSIFDYENQATYERNKKALLAIEIILPDDSSTGLLSVHAIDMQTQKIAAAQLFKISDLDLFLEPDTLADLSDQTPNRVELRGGAKNIQRVANLPEPYRFELAPSSAPGPINHLVAHTLLTKTDLLMVGSRFIEAAYGNELAEPESWRGMANGRVLFSEAEPEDTFELSLEVVGSERTLPAGTIRLSIQEAE